LLYDSIGYDVKYTIGKENEKHDAKLTNRKTGEEISIEEKGLSYPHACCPVELIQDVKTTNMGWFYKTKAQWIIMIYFQKGQPNICYAIDMRKLREYPAEYIDSKECFSHVNNKGYGDTINLNIPWKLLLRDNIAKVLQNFNNNT